MTRQPTPIRTWNVLHRIHAENWREAVPDLFPDESQRIERITAWLGSQLDEAERPVLCLQEVSGDQLASLERAFEGVTVFTYPRLPRMKGGRSPLADSREHLVTIAADATTRSAAAFDADPGKGYLIVEVDGLLVVNTHVSWGDKRAAQLATIKDAVGDDACVICGDFNATADQVLAGLGPGFACVDLGAGALPTRPRPGQPPAKSMYIDHIITRGVEAGAGRVLDVGGLSDHNLVAAQVPR